MSQATKLQAAGHAEPLIDREALGRLLRAARVAAGMTVPELAERVGEVAGRGTTPRMIYSYERAESDPDLDRWLAPPWRSPGARTPNSGAMGSSS